jgi:hypothetical protein
MMMYNRITGFLDSVFKYSETSIHHFYRERGGLKKEQLTPENDGCGGP